MIQIHLSREDFERKSSYLEEKQGVKLSGDQGTIEKRGVKATYTYGDGLLTVEIIDKPFFVTTAYCEEQLHKLLA